MKLKSRSDASDNSQCYTSAEMAAVRTDMDSLKATYTDQAVNGLHLYTAFLVKVLCQHSPINSYTFVLTHSGQGCLLEVPTCSSETVKITLNNQCNSHQEQIGVQYLAQRHFKCRGAGDKTTSFLISRRPALPPEPQLSLCVCLNVPKCA